MEGEPPFEEPLDELLILTFKKNKTEVESEKKKILINACPKSTDDKVRKSRQVKSVYVLLCLVLRGASRLTFLQYVALHSSFYEQVHAGPECMWGTDRKSVANVAYLIMDRELILPFRCLDYYNFVSPQCVDLKSCD